MAMNNYFSSLTSEINKTFWVIVYAIFLFPIIGFLISLFKNGIKKLGEIIRIEK